MDFNEDDARIGLILPEFIEEEDGFYTQGVRILRPIACTTTEVAQIPNESAFEIYDLEVPIPKTKTTLIWKAYHDT